jgi:hypothetical protein
MNLIKDGAEKTPKDYEEKKVSPPKKFSNIAGKKSPFKATGSPGANKRGSPTGNKRASPGASKNL